MFLTEPQPLGIMTIRGHRIVFDHLAGGRWLCVSCMRWNHWHELRH